MLSSAAPIFAESSDVRFLDGLARYGLFESATLFFSDRIDKITGTEKYPLAVEYVRTLTQQAIQAEPGKRKELRERLKNLDEQFLGPVDDGADPTRTLARLTLRFQFAIATFSFGDVARLESTIASPAERDAVVHHARKSILDAIDQFKSCFEALNELRRRTSRNVDQDFERKTLALVRGVRFQWGLAQESFALTYPAGDDRIISFNTAIDILSDVAGLPVDDDVVYRAQIELATCYRTVGDAAKAQATLDTLRNKNLSPEIRYRASTEQLRTCLAVGDTEGALREFSQDRPDTALHPDYDIARLELFLEIDRRNNNSANRDKMLELVRRIERQSGPYWGRRARQALTSARSASTVPSDGENAEILQMLAEEQFRNGKFSEAVQLYDKASVAAEASDDKEAAFKFGLAAVAVLDGVARKLDRTPDVSETEKATFRLRTVDALRKLATRFSSRPESSELHLKAIDDVSEFVGKELSLEKYVEILTEHVRTWPTSEKVPPLLLRSALIFEQKRRPDAALDVLERIPNASTVGADAVNAAGRCLLLQKERSDSKAAAWFEKRISPTVSWNDADVRSALLAAEYWNKAFLSDKNADAPKNAERLMKTLLERRADLPTTEKAKALANLVSALTEQGRQTEAAAVLEKLDGNSSTLSPAEQRNLLLTKARVLADTGDVQGAINLLAKHLEAPKNRTDYESWETLADILMRQNQSAAIGKSLDIWKQIAVESPKESEIWWNAREMILRVLLKAGKTEEAKKELDWLRTLYPQLGGELRKNRFETILN